MHAVRTEADPTPSERWESLSSEIRSCALCALSRTRTNAVVYRGGRRPWVLFVGEAPGAEEDRQGLPFVGRAGHRLDEAISRIGLTESDYGVVNLLKCRPPENRFDRAAAATCRPYLDRQFALLRPSVYVPLGRWALVALDPTAPSVTRAAGRPRSWEGRTIFPLIHPAAVRSRATRARWESDTAALARFLTERRR